MRSNAIWYPTAVAVVTVAFFALGGFLFFAWGQQGMIEASPRPIVEAHVGYIAGRTFDEGGQVPVGLQVCARSVLSGTLTCTVPQATGEYILEVPDGQYLVYSYQLSAPATRAYYTTALTCEEDRACDATVVHVTAGATVDEVYPVDWALKE
ncbi:MAG: hypothetical protein ACOYBJ_03505 [Patescibacteria group bacterium]